jgi:hypothetical protein
MKKLILVLFLFVVAYFGFYFVKGGLTGFREAAAHGGSDAACERRLTEMCKTMNAKLPRQSSPNIRFDSVAPGPGRRVTYTYTFVNVSSTQLNPADLAAEIKPQFVSTYKTDPGMAEFRKMEVEIKVVYLGKDGNEAGSFVVSPKDL